METLAVGLFLFQLVCCTRGDPEKPVDLLGLAKRVVGPLCRWEVEKHCKTIPVTVCVWGVEGDKTRSKEGEEAVRPQSCSVWRSCLKRGIHFDPEKYRNLSSEETRRALSLFYTQTVERYSEAVKWARENMSPRGPGRIRRSPDGVLGKVFAIVDALMLKINEKMALKIYSHEPGEEIPAEKYIPLFEKVDAIMLFLNEKFAKIKYKHNHPKLIRSADKKEGVTSGPCIPIEKEFCRELPRKSCGNMCNDVKAKDCRVEWTEECSSVSIQRCENLKESGIQEPTLST